MIILKKIGIKLNIFIIKFKYHLFYGNSFIMKKNSVFRKRFEINIHDSECRIIIGSGCFFNNDCSLNCRKSIEIDNNCIFGENVKIYDHNHGFKEIDILIKKQEYTSKGIVIGDNCWIGSNVVILAGTTVGSGSIIGAGTVVYDEIPVNTIVTSNRTLIFNKRENLSR